MGLAEEVAASQSGDAKEVAAEAQEVKAQEELMNTGLPVAEEVKQEDKPAAGEAKKEDPHPAIAKIKIGGKEFNTQEEAIQYAQDLELARIQDEAFKQGATSAQPKEEQNEGPTIEEQIEDMLFDNPKEALLKYKENIKEEITSTIKQESQREQQTNKMWSDFYSKNPDLANSQELVTYVMEKNWNDVGYLEADKGLQIIAEKARGVLKSYKDDSLPKTELSSAPVVMTGSTGEQPPVPAKTAEKALDFIAEVNNMRKRRGSTTSA